MAPITMFMSEEEAAAVKIQAAARGGSARRIVVRYAPAQPQVAAAPGHQLLAVVCPAGAGSGSSIMITAPDGRCGSTGHPSPLCPASRC